MFYQHVAEPVAVPNIKNQGAKTIELGSPSQIKFSYQIKESIYSEGYLQSRGLENGVAASGDQQLTAGASVHKVYGTTSRSVSLGIGIDAGNSEGEPVGNLRSFRRISNNREIMKHDLSYQQIYAQASWTPYSSRLFSLGLSYKWAWGKAQFKSGVFDDPRTVTIQPVSEESPTLLGTPSLRDDLADTSQPLSYGTFAFSLRGKLEQIIEHKVYIELQLRVPGNSRFFRSRPLNSSLSIGYEF